MSKVFARDRLEAALARIDDPNGEGARACLTVYREAAKAAADAADARARAGISLGPLDGAIVTVKDLFDVAGEVTRAGSKVLAEEGKPAAARCAGGAPAARGRRASSSPRPTCRNSPSPASAPIRISARRAIRPTAPAFPAARARAARWRWRTAYARSPSAATPAAPPAFRRRSAASSATSRAASASRPTASFRCRRAQLGRADGGLRRRLRQGRRGHGRRGLRAA